MARLNIAPTKSNQLNLRRDLDMATEGFNLLDQKREILVMELMRMLDRVRRTQQRLIEAEEKAYTTLRKAIAHNGYHRMRNVASGISYEHEVRTHTRVTAGVRVPEITVKAGEFASRFGFSGTDSLVDQTMLDFLELLVVVSEMAQIETAVWLLARELKRTQRRVNALEQIFIPDFDETLHYISDVLESKELESFFVMKLVKKRLAAKHRID
ncbi:MAG: V-type ATP synthase subunit D [Kiritimatiellaeota bacterium]|nr:V-type ATP synthase subunit D [Kiritimatiellota bacterium]